MKTTKEQMSVVRADVTKDGTKILGEDGDCFLVQFPNGRTWHMYFSAYYQIMKMKGLV